MDRAEIIRWLTEPDPAALERLWRCADETRRAGVGDDVHLRGLVEISNHCRRDCLYCGLRRDNRQLARYRMNSTEIRACAETAAELGYGTVVLQAGEDEGISADWMAGIVTRIKDRTPLAITLSLGERSETDYIAWRQAGADRYLLRFETSNRALYERIHPPVGDMRSDRVAILRRLRELGYQIGGGVMIGIPGQTNDDLADDIELFAAMDLDMIGVGPYIPHAATPLAKHPDAFAAPPGRQVFPDEATAYKVIALTRLACPRANIPATTAVATLNDRGRELALARGANVIMPNLTPRNYRLLYETYPDKACNREDGDFARTVKDRIVAIGRSVGVGRGDRIVKPKESVPRCAQRTTGH